MPSSKTLRRDLIMILLDVIVVGGLYRLAVATDPIGELTWMGVVLGIGTAAVAVMAALVLGALALGYWFFWDRQYPVGGLRALPASSRMVYAAGFLAAILSMIVLGSVGSRVVRSLTQMAMHAS